MQTFKLEERRHERILRNDRVAFRVLPGTACPDAFRRESSGRTSDLSESGACIVTDVPVPVGATLELRITIMEPPSLYSFKSVVRWSKQVEPHGVWKAGVEFSPNAGELAKDWRKLIEGLREMTHAPQMTAA